MLGEVLTSRQPYAVQRSRLLMARRETHRVLPLNPLFPVRSDRVSPLFLSFKLGPRFILTWQVKVAFCAQWSGDQGWA